MPTTSKALVLSELNAPFELREVVVDDPRPGEVLVKMIACGICHSDLSVQSGILPGQFPSCLGHEGAGMYVSVESVGPDVAGLEKGDSVLLSFNFCSDCRSCHANKTSQCKAWLPLNFGLARSGEGKSHFAEDSETGQPIAGLFFGQSSFSEYTLAAANSCVKIPASSELALLAPLGCGIQTGSAGIAGSVMNALRPAPDSFVGVWGLGGVGVAAICAAAYLGVKTIIAIDIIPGRLELARECGATYCINGKTEDVEARIKEITGGEMLDFAIEASGVKACMYAAWGLLGNGGKLCQLGAFSQGTEVSLDINGAQVRHLSFVGNLEGASHPPTFIPQLLEMRKAGFLPLEKFSTQYPITEFEAALKAMKEGS
ncbi:BZ3500_MvSof-1268-A1-R1_Chr2-3g05399 [Microbotryum saponariae]|uniref:BZ3500_MvSof-1268-A1-R1_Chr2-3g05399 protein n=1 Tax=Microbotryum saponariae TaxID=289078 RepID=A0A2X0KPB9_9BASI|nr:BZ3500_MvSof-1268-A1-R1_Chr2-3g05399 [Microbotryum saponariae]SDA01362.1 BZ3501_MvSof-1269-A2-R1_Chr2-2g05072 [Microbotryum saponariae]